VALLPQRKAGGRVVNDTEIIVYEVMDMVERLDRKVNRLLEDRGIDPQEAGVLPVDEDDEQETAEAKAA
jgi:hypothetical protein